MTEPPLLSVIIPVFNMERYIGQCLSTILNLEDPAIEVVVVDDGSTDRTRLVLDTYSDARLKVIRQTNAGPSAARNTGFENSRGRFILPFDADDIPVVENWRFILAALRANPEAVLAYGARHIFDGDADDFPRSLASREAYPPNDKVVPLIFRRNFMQMGSAIIRREAIAAAGMWNEKLRVGEDWDLWCRLACLGPFIFCPVLVIGYRRHCQSATGAPIPRDASDPALAAIDSIYSSAMVKRRAGRAHRRLKQRALAWQTYHWGTRLIRSGAVWAGAKAILWAIAMDTTHLSHACGYPGRRLRRWMAAGNGTEQRLDPAGRAREERQNSLA